MKTLHRLLAIAAHLPLAFALCAPASAQAQRAAPNLGFVYPAGGQQGATFTVSVGGQNLAAGSVAYVSGDGIRARTVNYERPLTQRELNDLREKSQALQDKRAAARKDATKPPFTPADEKMAADIRQQMATRGNRQAAPALAETVTLEVTVARDASPGDRELRLKTPGGLSNPLVFCVGQLPEITDPVVNAMASRPPRSQNSDPRGARTVATKEFTVPAVLNGQILPGEVDRFRFKAKKGQRLTLAESARALMPYLADAVPGWFQATLALYDAQGRELAYDDDFRFNPDPVLLREIPADGEYTIEIKDAIYRGREDFVYRIAVGELPFVTSIFPLGGPIAGRATFALTGWNLANEKLVLDTMERRAGTFLLSVRNNQLLSNSVRFALDTRPELLALDPAECEGQPQALTLPVIVNGRIARPGADAQFRFEGKAGDEFVAEVLARRLGSPLDSVLTLTDAQGRTVALNDDYDDKGAGLLTHHADSRLSARLPADGVYRLRLADAQRHGGPEYGYRLRVGAPQPDFELRVVPSTVNLRAGASAPITVYALRRDGFEGEILLGLIEAPRGFALSGARIPAGQEKVQLTVTAPAQPGDELFTFALVGQATVNGRTIQHTAVPADDRMQAFAYRHLVPAREFKATVTGRGTPFRSAVRQTVQITPGGTARLRISAPVGRATGKVLFELTDPPSGISVKQCSTQGDYVEVVIACDATKAKPGTTGNLVLEGHSERPATKAGKAANVVRAPLGFVPAIPFEILGPALTRK